MNRVDEFRHFNNSRLPRWYEWRLHIGANLAILLAVSYATLSWPESFPPMHTIWIATYFLAWSVIEYGVHRFLLHGNLGSNLKFREQHSLFHHSYFTAIRIAAERAIDTNRVLLFTSDLGAVLLLNFAISSGLYAFSPAHARLFFFAGTLYVAVYEVAHAVCHSRSYPRFLRALVDHHRTHHSQKYQQSKNFSVIFPFLDSLFGTKAGHKLTPFTLRRIEHGSREERHYQKKKLCAFRRPISAENQESATYGVYEGRQLVGGFTLCPHESLVGDRLIRKYWNVLSERPGIRISQLWTVPDRSVAVAFILKEITEMLPKDKFVYGLLSLPLGFAKRKSGMFTENDGLLGPCWPLESCGWSEDAEPSSEGRRLLHLYRELGTSFYGPPSGCASDQSVRVVVGLKIGNARLEKLEKVLCRLS